MIVWQNTAVIIINLSRKITSFFVPCMKFSWHTWKYLIGLSKVKCFLWWYPTDCTILQVDRVTDVSQRMTTIQTTIYCRSSEWQTCLRGWPQYRLQYITGRQSAGRVSEDNHNTDCNILQVARVTDVSQRITKTQTAIYYRSLEWRTCLMHNTLGPALNTTNI